ncbi:DUF1307 domain-containing protein (plasmid) [Staphylococcus sp. NRL 16/872]|uniref:DUF1307 domain-containing protein n=1 Tax=Staphylococcus sp. NRL 16/872 TaxID=2930131 RepID=UPI001FB53DCE|nr:MULTISPECIES: DUF1307 domain-containing protein [unclassified Staphylococcus]MCJ1657319.1 DUF1307 domain-containing protein [Staphylococcus sp. NRL 21/187]MCJ1663056.1 DUF1307 domain-containing protein [Staphylococcus sp. NRL 18/288]MCJ1669196.1 DUF1307 domain-containing protein [Staphylococcus sp. NRL 19/737]WEN70661.1 DUF1307 domain-containing protein [Staphylococcus sp. NRL 16/872]
MKKIIGLVASIVILITLSACGNEKNKTFVGKQSNVKVEVTYTYKGDKIIKQKYVSTLKYSDFGINDDTSKKRVKEKIENQSEKMQDVKGVKESIKESDGGFVETINVDFEKAEIDTLKSKGIVNIAGNTGTSISMKKTEKKMKENGFKEKED